jgi:septin family protein
MKNITNTMVLLGSTGITRTSFVHKLSIKKQPEHQNATKAYGFPMLSILSASNAISTYRPEPDLQA